MYLNFAKRVDLKCPRHRRKKILTIPVAMDIDLTYCGDHYVIHTYIELCCTTETKVIGQLYLK